MNASSRATSRAVRALLVLSLASGVARAADIHVEPTGDDGRNGSTWAASVRTIGRAIAVARASAGGDVIHVAAGTYVENIAFDQPDTQLLGGYPPGGGTRDPAANPTIVDGNATAPALTISANGGLTVIGGITVDGFTFRNGRQIGRPDIIGAGAGVFIEEAEVVLTNNVFRNNVSDGVGLIGAGLYVYRFAARPSTIMGNVFENNEARDGGGGAIGLVDAATAVTTQPIDFASNQIRNNRASAGPATTPGSFAGVGGGMVAWKGKPRISNNVIENNVAESTASVAYTGQGGGLFLYDSNPTITGNTISNNLAQALGANFGGSGGAMYAWFSTSLPVDGPDMMFNGNTVSGNRAQGGTGSDQAAGGGVTIGIVGHAEPELRDNTFTNNTAVGGGDGSAQGGGLFVYMRESGPAQLTIDGGTFEGNSAASGGGGLWLQGGLPRRLGATNLLIRDNRSDRGSGVFVFGPAVVRNSRIRENRLYDPDGDQVSEISDNCPGLANPVQSDADGDDLGDACDSDDDGDGTPDSGDACPLVAGGGCAGDMDGDGVGDATDNCPLVANPTQADATGEGTGDACEPATFDALETNAGGAWVEGDATLTNLEIVRNVGQGLLIVGFPGDATNPENHSSPLVTNVTIAENEAAGFITFLADGTVLRDSVIARNVLSDGFDTERAPGVPSSPNVTCNDVYFWDGVASLPCTGTGNMDFTDGDAYFTTGNFGDHYLAQVASGQANTFVAVDAGGVAATASDVAGLTTRTDGVVDAGNVDLGYHYPLSVSPVPIDVLTGAVRVTKSATAVQLSLVGAPPSLASVRWYRGEIDVLLTEYTHSTPFTGSPGDPECAGPPTATVPDPSARLDGRDWYYLAVQVEAGVEGSLGTDSRRNPRPRADDLPTDRVVNGCP